MRTEISISASSRLPTRRQEKEGNGVLKTIFPIRKLPQKLKLEATLDLAERRRIRSAIRELQRQELERDEEALASKRFRPERGSHRQDDKENWPRVEPLAAARSGESSQQDDAEQPVLTGPEESACGGAAERPPAQEHKGSAAETFIPLSPSPCWLFVLALEGPGLALERWRELSGWGKDELAHKRDNVVEQEHVPAEMQELRSRQAGDSQKPSVQEVTLGLRSTPIRITTVPSSSSICSISSNVAKPVEPEVVEQPQALRLEPELPNGMEKVQVRELERKSKLNIEELNRIEDEDTLDKMLDRTTDFEERRLIRNAMRELRQRKRGHTMETTATQSTQLADGSAHSTITKTERLVQSSDGTKTSRTTTMESSYVKRSDSGNSTFVQTKSSYSSSSKKTGSIFDREDESASRQSSLAALERRQAEKKKELMKAQSLPKTSASQARKAMMEKLQKEGGSSPNPAAARTTVQRSSSFGVPNANSIKQMLLDWCRAKTRGYEHVDIQNFSSSWSDGMAFCALVHNFFPEAFDYSQLTPQNRRHNFEVAFSSAEKHADCPQLLDVEDMVRMREPDWKCVYTYIQEFYRCLVQKGLVKTKKS
nr:PREDICTED: smoothelin [Opisthocomus hoazin]